MKLIRKLVILGVAVGMTCFLMFLWWKLHHTEPTLHSSFEWLEDPPSPGFAFCPHPFSNLTSESLCGFTTGSNMHQPENWIATCGISGPLQVNFDDGAGASPSAPKSCYAVPPGAVFWNESRPHPWLTISIVTQQPVEFFTWGMYDFEDSNNIPPGGYPRPLLLSHAIMSTGAFSLSFAFKEKREMVNNLQPDKLVVTPMWDPLMVGFRECITCPGVPRASNPTVTKPDKAMLLMIHPRSLWKEVLFEKPSFTLVEMMPMLAAVGTAILKMREVLVGRGKVEDPYNPWGVVQKVFVNIRRPEVLDNKLVRATQKFFKNRPVKTKEYWKIYENDKWLRKHYVKSSEISFGREPKGKKGAKPPPPAEEEEEGE